MVSSANGTRDNCIVLTIVVTIVLTIVLTEQFFTFDNFHLAKYLALSLLALKQKQNHIPFRDSKLTYLLQDSLSKDNKALMITQISPTESDVGETICTLQFATRVRGVELGAGEHYQ